MAAGGATDDPYLTRVIKSNAIHTTTGEVVPPYKVDEYPSDWLDAILAYSITVPRRSAELQKAKNGR